MADEEKMDVDEAPAAATPSKPSLLTLMDLAHAVAHPDPENPAATASDRESLLRNIKENNMAPLFRILVAAGTLPADAVDVSALAAANDAANAKFDAEIADAREKSGEVEVFERQKAKAEYAASIGDRAGCLAVYAAITHTHAHLSTGQKIDIVMAKARLALAFEDLPAARAAIEEAKTLNEKGGDWDRRNRLKVYEGLVCLLSRDFRRASGLFLDSLATFTAAEVASFAYTCGAACLTAVLAVDRPTLKKKVLDSPDVLSVAGELGDFLGLARSLYDCTYDEFLRTLVRVCARLRRDRYMARHASYYLHEMRIAAYAQFLESYKSVTIASMASKFGVSVPFLDGELARFIASTRISAKIDALTGVIETNRPDAKNAQYLAVIKQGDALLNKVQKLARVVAV